MVHVFTIHSPITLLSALGTIRHEGIDTQDVLLLCSDGYKPRLSPEFRGRVIRSFDETEKTLRFLQRIRQFNYSRAADRFINEIVSGSGFVAYVDLMSMFNRYLVLHPLCRGFHVIEEGMVNYADYDDFNLWTTDLRLFDWKWTGPHQWRQMMNGMVRLLRGRSLRMLSLPIHPNLYTLHRGVNAYCFSEFAFACTPVDRKKVMSWDPIPSLLDEDGFEAPAGSWFWIGDVFASHFRVPLSLFEEALHAFMREVNPSRKRVTIFVRFRGVEPEAEKQLTIRILGEYNFEIRLIEQPLVMEMVFLTGKSLTVCGIASSLLLYAHLMGHTTHSMYRYFPETYNSSFSQNYKTVGRKVGYSS